MVPARVQEVAGPYDAVVIATPLEHSSIEFRGLRLAHRPKRHYQRVVTTYVVGRLRAAYFGVATLPSGHALSPKPYTSSLAHLPVGHRAGSSSLTFWNSYQP